MTEATIWFKKPKHKTQAWTRKKLWRERRAVALEDKKASRLDIKRGLQSARREARVTAVFVGCDPVRTLKLIGEE